MRKSRILKLLSYIFLPIFIGILIISTFYIQVKDATYYDEEKYFESESFMSLYMTRLSDISRKLIYKNPEYKFDPVSLQYISHGVQCNRQNQIISDSVISLKIQSQGHEQKIGESKIHTLFIHCFEKQQ